MGRLLFPAGFSRPRRCRQQQSLFDSSGGFHDASSVQDQLKGNLLPAETVGQPSRRQLSAAAGPDDASYIDAI
ncbi:hypothetical protein [Geobacillus stearothermophilus]|uniref:hypothetical protein n=1 Tax=Geobacillus stearothermophilus TaxID=1422 RepID=UPI0024029A3F|nr:hypothetical protein [Geobacillus stearothermophilus]MDF9296438.1 hypothetical protein [Geobacillus stearothermophilus]